LDVARQSYGELQMDDSEPDDPLTPEEEGRMRLLTADEIRYIDERLMSQISHRWYKVARVVGRTLMDLQKESLHIPAAFYCLRIKHLAEVGLIESAGDLNRMRYSEVRLPGPYE